MKNDRAMFRPIAAVALLVALSGCGDRAPIAAPQRPAALPRLQTANPPPPAPKPAPIATARLVAAAGKQSKALKLSIGVYDAATGDPLYEANGGVARRSASVMKLATTAAALLALGPQAELATEVFATSSPRGGVVRGDLVVRGAGDPGINNRAGPGAAEAALRALAASVREAGVREVEGALLVDDTAFSGPDRHPGWGWSDGEWAWYMAPVASVTLTDSCVELTVAPGRSEGAAALLRTDPTTNAVRFLDRVTTAPSSQKKTNVVLGRTDSSGAVPVTGSVPLGSAGYRFEAACVDPAAHFGDVFLRVLGGAGVEVAGGVRVVGNPGEPSSGPRIVSADPSELVPLARHATSVLDVVRVANKHSQNLYAEMLLRAVGRKARGEGTFEGGCRAVRAILGFADGDPTFTQVDGSGLARENEVTVGALGRVLARMYRAPCAREFIGSLAEPGEPDSTLRNRLESAKYGGRVFAKTGTLRDTSSLAGYVRGKSGRTFAFVVLCEGEVGRARDVQDDVVDALVEQ